MQLVERVADELYTKFFGIVRPWSVQPIAARGMDCYGRWCDRGVLSELALVRLDDDPDTAEPRIVEKEIEHA